MYTYIHIYIYTCIHIYTYIHISIYTCIRIYIYIHTYMLCVCKYIYRYNYIHTDCIMLLIRNWKYDLQQTSSRASSDSSLLGSHFTSAKMGWFKTEPRLDAAGAPRKCRWWVLRGQWSRTWWQSSEVFQAVGGIQQRQKDVFTKKRSEKSCNMS